MFTAALSVFLFLSVAPPSRFGWVVRAVIKGVMMGMLGYACYRAGGTLGRALLSLRSVQSLLENLRPPPAWPHWSPQSHQWHDLWFTKTMHHSPMALKQEVRLEERVHQPQTMNLQGRQGVKSLPPSYWCPCRRSRAVLPKKPWQYSLFAFIFCADPAFCKVYKGQ